MGWGEGVGWGGLTYVCMVTVCVVETGVCQYTTHIAHPCRSYSPILKYLTLICLVVCLYPCMHGLPLLSAAPASKPKPIWESWLEELFVEADTNNDGFLDESEIVRLCLEHNVGLPEDAIRKKFQVQQCLELYSLEGYC